MLIGASDFRYPVEGLGKPGRLIWVGGAGLLLELVPLLLSLRLSGVRAALLAPTPHQSKGRVLFLLRALAVLQAVAVTVVWL
jgi:hypothetical protein